jgi:hypothetical protein
LRSAYARLAFAIFALTLFLPVSRASATPIVVTNSTYAFRVQGTQSGFAVGIATFDGAAESFTDHSLAITIDEQETDFANNTAQILIQFLANGDIFPAAGEAGTVSIGRTFGPPLDLAVPVLLISAVETFYNAGGAYASAEWAAQMNGNPWDGFFLVPGVLAGFSDVGGLGTNRIDLLFTVTPLAAVPEPASLTLLALGLAGAGIVLRRIRPRVFTRRS